MSATAREPMALAMSPDAHRLRVRVRVSHRRDGLDHNHTRGSSKARPQRDLQHAAARYQQCYLE
jgi:hypothetical protein